MSFTHTVASEDRDFREWHGGRGHALVWALLLDDEEVADCFAAARARLSGLILPRYERQPHVTLAFAGLAAQPGLPGYDDAALKHDLAILRPLVAGPVDVRPSGWGSFPMVPYLAVESQWLHRTHEALAQETPAEHQMNYVPHVTVGHWCGEWPRTKVLGQLDSTFPGRVWQVGGLSLMRYETHDIAGPLEELGNLNLTDGRWVEAKAGSASSNT